MKTPNLYLLSFVLTLGQGAVFGSELATTRFAGSQPATQQIDNLRYEIVRAEQITQTWIFSEPLIWVGATPADETETTELSEIVSRIRAAMNNPGVLTTRQVNGKIVPASWRLAPVDYSELERFVSEHPQSPWTPSLRANLGLVYRKQGRYTLALEHWEKAWSATKGLEGEGKQVADFALTHGTSLLASLGRVDTLKEIFEETKDRPLGGHLRQMFDSAREGYQSMLVRPGYSFQCGTYALHSVATALGRTNFLLPTGADSPAVKLLNVPSPDRGFTMKALADLAATNGLGLAAVKRTSGSVIPVPAVVHWRQSHYAAIVAQQGDDYRVVDQTFGEATWLSGNAINAEGSGYFLVARESVPSGWDYPAANELALVHGKGAPNYIKDENDQHNCEMPGNNGAECQTNCVGMARWWVSEPYITLWLEDEPLGYHPSRGPRVALHLSYKNRNTRPSGQFNFGFGSNWECSWMSGIGLDSFTATVVGNQTNVTYDAVIYLPRGGVQRHSATNQPLENSVVNYYSQTTLFPVLSGLQPTGWERRYADRSKDVYQLAPYGTHSQNFLLSAKIDALGNTTSFGYDGSNRLTTVWDVDGRTNSIIYGTNGPSGNQLITTVTDPFGRSANFIYRWQLNVTQWYLTNIVDPEGIFSRMVWDTNLLRVVQLTTSYKYTYFTYGGTASGDFLGTGGIARQLSVTDSDGGSDVFLYRDDSSGLVASSYFDAPGGSATPIGTIENSNMQYRNSFYWDRRQLVAASTNVQNFTAMDYLLGRMRHWLHLPNSQLHVGGSLSFERRGNPNGGPITGQRAWYDYPDKAYGNPNYEGSTALPGVIAHHNPGGGVYYKWYRRNALGRPTNIVETWSPGAAYVSMPGSLRTNIYRYASNGIDLVEHIGPNGERLAGLAYNDRHQVTFFTNALDEVTALTYNGLYQLSRIDFPNGVSNLFSYYASGAFPNWLERVEQQPIGRIDAFQYTNGVISQWTDARGLLLRFGWDKLERVRSITFPDNTYISNRYDKLDTFGVRDRLGNWTYFDFDGSQRLLTVTNALSKVTQFLWCACGSLDKITDALNRETLFERDNLSRPSRILDDDLITAYGYDLLDRLTAISKGYTAPIQVRTFEYTLHGLLARATTDTNQSYAVQYDNRNRPVWFTNSVGLVFTNAYDNLNRLVARGWPNGTTETFVYTNNGLVAYTDRLGFTTRLFRDFANRTLLVTNASTNRLQFVYNAAGDLVSFTDGKSQTTTWTYDVHGNMRTNSVAGTDVLRLTYDALNRVTNRWMPATSNTVYAYNALDSLTNLSYRAGVTQTVTFAYDALQRLTNMVDSIGTHAYTWSQRGNMLSEDGPWQNDTLSLGYLHELRTRLTLQQSNATSWRITNSFDASHRLETMITPSGNYGYEYLSGGGLDSDLVQKLTLSTGSYITNQYDSLGQLKESELDNSAGLRLNRHIYAYDHAGQRTNAYFSEAKDFWACAYDPAGQLKSAQPKYNGGNTSYPHEIVDWTYDAAENVATRSRGGLTYAFNTDSRNRLTNITRSGTITVAGFATNNAASASVNGQPATMYGDKFAAAGVTLNDGANTFTAIAQDVYGRNATNTMTANYPATITFSYDANGNMLWDGTRTFKYDGENRLTNVFVTAQWRTDFRYDGLGRKRIRRDYNWVSGAWSRTNEVRYVCDGFLVLQERNSNNVPRVTYTRGSDFSGGFDGAGGIGGLLGMTTHSQTSNYTHYFYHSDGMGNITALQDTNQVIQARYAYDPWGNLFSMSGGLTNLNRMRMAGKEWHPQSGLMDFGARFYNPNWQRWINEDPLGINGGLNLHRYVANNPFNYIDPYGLWGLGVGAEAAAAKLAEAAAAAEAAAGTAGGISLGAALGYGLPTAAAGGLAGYGIGLIPVGHGENVHDLISKWFVPEDNDSSPLPLPGGSMRPPPRNPPTTTSAPCPGGNGRGGENEYTARGREAHKWREYEGFDKEVELRNGDRVDFLNPNTRQIIELKPFNPAKMSQYLKQLQRYLDQLNKERPGSTPWTGRIEYY